MLRVYMLIIVVGLIGGVVYGAYAYYNDTQQRIKTLQENNAKLETVAKTNELTINSLQQSQEKFAELQRLFKKIKKNKGIGISSNPDIEAVLKDMETNLNLPVVIKKKGNDLKLSIKL